MYHDQAELVRAWALLSTALVPKMATSRRGSASETETDFAEVVHLIEVARQRAFRSVNTSLIDLYWRVGAYISRKIESAVWGEAVVEQLAGFINTRHPDLKGFTRASLFRMRQFYEVYRRNPIVAPLVRQLPWTHNLLILARCKRPEEREFYLRHCQRERWGKRELERHLSSALFERTVLSPPRASPMVTHVHPGAISLFKDTYLLDFLDLPDRHDEADLHRGLVANLRRFLLELGRDFAFVGEQYRVQVGGRDFQLDLLFFHRGLQALVAIELKVGEFQPEHLGKLEFYLEALDRDVRKPHERPSIGVLLCATRDAEVVEYALSRTLSPALVAEYVTRLPEKALLQAKLHEFYALAQPAPAASTRPVARRRTPSRR